MNQIDKDTMVGVKTAAYLLIGAAIVILVYLLLFFLSFFAPCQGTC